MDIRDSPHLIPSFNWSLLTEALDLSTLNPKKTYSWGFQPKKKRLPPKKMDHSHPSAKKGWLKEVGWFHLAQLRRSFTNWHDNPIQVVRPPGVFETMDAWLLSGFKSNPKQMVHPIHHLDVSENNGTPKSSILIGVFHYKPSIWDTPMFGNIHLELILEHPSSPKVVGIESKK